MLPMLYNNSLELFYYPPTSTGSTIAVWTLHVVRKQCLTKTALPKNNNNKLYTNNNQSIPTTRWQNYSPTHLIIIPSPPSTVHNRKSKISRIVEQLTSPTRTAIFRADDTIIPRNAKLKRKPRTSDFRSWVVAGYLGCWPGCWLHGRRQGRAAGPSFAFRVPPFFSRLLRHIPRPGCGNHARAGACAAATTMHAWASVHERVHRPRRRDGTRWGTPFEQGTS